MPCRSMLFHFTITMAPTLSVIAISVTSIVIIVVVVSAYLVLLSL